ncbi:hypothetical protein A3I48_02570 [Candidatus Daviesbacteria bacterium RIFCSPLOWO2_02_FULL_36_7]|uniref:Glycosyltransferase RgtA/B/C/D-like domain-containing protein n=1 Tax=Candidatus Daviesbacteria bacterium RIFCSPLOWO2_02_FULL_36_7 TaxID=1797792 RepID=A0A1F5MIA5_9BACT|nr:MAG: hypothetical protein A3I48_02570 [Candidatus Daviesbacteria bacterium RIFCSPLOWO2_02_FULL_36_7]
MFNKRNLIVLLALILIFVFGFWLRYRNIADYNLILDYDQIEDQFYTYSLAVDRNLLIIGRAIYGDPRLHHGVFYYYYNFIPFLLSSGNFLVSTYWNIFFNVTTAIILFIFARLMFKKNLPGLIAAVIAASSFEFIKFSNWLTIDTVAIFLVPLFFLGLWSYFQDRKWGLILSLISLGLAIQTDLSFLYLIPIILIYWFIFRPRMPSFKLALFSVLAFTAATFTLILTEIKLNFAGVKTLINFSNVFEEAHLTYIERVNFFFKDFIKDFTNNLFPQRPELGIFLTGSIILVILYYLFSNKTTKLERQSIYFLLLYLFAPAITLLIGYHNKPWFLIGLPPAIALITGYAISKFNLFIVIPIVFLIMGNSVSMILQRPNESYKLFDNIYDSTSYLKYQLQTVDYTYKESQGRPFAINAVTYPLYYNGLWAYLYYWYGKGKYKYLPDWLGGDQLHPYNLLTKSQGDEQIFYMIISDTSRIPDVYKNQGKIWAVEHGRLIEEKKFNGFTILKMERKNESI